jgi:hypothetical protein
VRSGKLADPTHQSPQASISEDGAPKAASGFLHLVVFGDSNERLLTVSPVVPFVARVSIRENCHKPVSGPPITGYAKFVGNLKSTVYEKREEVSDSLAIQEQSTHTEHNPSGMVRHIWNKTSGPDHPRGRGRKRAGLETMPSTGEMKARPPNLNLLLRILGRPARKHIE